MVVVVEAQEAAAVAVTLRAQGESVHEIGTIVSRGAGAAVVVS